MKRIKLFTHQMIKVGITGGIGSGKTTVCKMFEKLGVAVYYADVRAKYLMQHEHYLIDEIKKHFGEDVYQHGELNRKLLAQKVFNHREQLDVLNSLVHPAVFHDTERWMEEQQKLLRPYVLKEAALLVETGAYKYLDKLIVVTAPINERMVRVSQRDHIEVEEVKQRIRHQLPEADKLKLADFVISNTGTIHQLQNQVDKLHARLLSLANVH